MSGFPGDDFYGESSVDRGDEPRADAQPIAVLACPVGMDLDIDYPEIPDQAACKRRGQGKTSPGKQGTETRGCNEVFQQAERVAGGGPGMILDPIIYFDLETGGLEVTSPIIQIAATAVRPNGCGSVDFEAKLDFDRAAADPEALAMNHYDPEVWQKQQVPVIEGLSAFANWISQWKCVEMVSKRTGRAYQVARLAGYNAAAFDMPILMHACKAAGIFLPAHPSPLDVMQLALWHFQGYKKRPESFKLADVCKFCGVALEGAHDALADVRATAALAAALTNPVPEEASAGWEPEKGDL